MMKAVVGVYSEWLAYNAWPNDGVDEVEAGTCHRACFLTGVLCNRGVNILCGQNNQTLIELYGVNILCGQNNQTLIELYNYT